MHFRWIGAALDQHIAKLPADLLIELKKGFAKNRGSQRKRKSKSRKQKRNAVAAISVDVEGEIGTNDNANQAVDIGSSVVTFEATDTDSSVDVVTVKAVDVDYGQKVAELTKALAEDTNVILVEMNAICVALLAKRLGEKFAPHAAACVTVILKKFVEKEANVVISLREAIDAIYPSTTLKAMQKNLLEALNGESPSVKAETASFLARAFISTQRAVFNRNSFIGERV